MPCDFAELTHYHRVNQFAMESRKRSDLALGALLRTGLGWSLNLPAEKRSAIRDKALELIAIGERELAHAVKSDLARQKGKKEPAPPAGIDDPVYAEWRMVIVSSLKSRQPMADIETVTTQRMEQLVAELPVAAWWRENVVASSYISLARILAETGDLSNYATVSKLWKRMGLAVLNGVRQGGLPKNAKAEDWIAHGYSPKRRSIMFVLGDSLMKGKTGYRTVYVARKAFEVEKAAAEGLTVLPAAKIGKKNAAMCRSEGHIHNRALRYMQKRLLRDLWAAWHEEEARRDVKPKVSLPPPHELSEAA